MNQVTLDLITYLIMGGVAAAFFLFCLLAKFMADKRAGV